MKAKQAKHSNHKSNNPYIVLKKNTVQQKMVKEEEGIETREAPHETRLKTSTTTAGELLAVDPEPIITTHHSTGMTEDFELSTHTICTDLTSGSGEDTERTSGTGDDANEFTQPEIDFPSQETPEANDDGSRKSRTLWMIKILDFTDESVADIVFQVTPSKQSGVGIGQEYIGRGVLRPIRDLRYSKSVVFCLHLQGSNDMYHFRRADQVLDFLRSLIVAFDNCKCEHRTPVNEVIITNRSEDDDESSVVSDLSDCRGTRKRIRRPWLSRLVQRFKRD